MNVAICGTARVRQGWPPKDYKNIFDEHFNSLYWNNVVTMVMTMHTHDETVSHVRKKLRVNVVNKENLNQIWGDSFARMIEICAIDADACCWLELPPPSLTRHSNLANLIIITYQDCMHAVMKIVFVQLVVGYSGSCVNQQSQML